MNSETTIETAPHSYGPWQIAEYCGVFGPSFTIVRGQRAIAHIISPGGYGHDYMRVPDQPEAQANARLIAAAPELLAALEALLMQEDWEGEDVDPRSPVGRARAAISIAKGTP